jgi:1-acyl-sn-glycerol-3-phosphate acyltransferase
MTVLDLQRMLRDTGGYETPPDARPSHPVRPGWPATWRFHGSTLTLGWRIRRCARRQRFNDAVWADCCFWLWRRVEALGATISCRGFKERAGHAGPVVYVANHMGLAETVLLPPMLLAFGSLTLVFKRSLLNSPFLREACRAMRPIAVSRVHAREDLQQVLEQGKACLADGLSVLLFPQATRQAVFNPARFNSLGEKLSREAGVPMVPIAVKTDFVAIGRLGKDFGPVDPRKPIRLHAGPLIAPERPRAERHQTALDFIGQALRAWGMPVAGVT